MVLAAVSPAHAIGYLLGTVLVPWLLISAIGWTYYAIKGPKLSFGQTMRKRWVIIASVVLIILSFLGRLGQVASTAR